MSENRNGRPYAPGGLNQSQQSNRSLPDWLADVKPRFCAYLRSNFKEGSKAEVFCALHKRRVYDLRYCVR
jgi:hypothetical protein